MSSSNPEISVVMPAYNHERFVGQAIESVLGQSFRDLEFIIVNDGSQDGTERVIKGFDDCRIRYFSQQNRGAHNALNFGISQARGRYLAIINSDDVYSETRLATLHALLEQGRHRLVFSDLLMADQGLRPLPESYPTVAWFERIKSVYRRTGSLTQSLFSGNWVVTTSNLFMETAFAREIGPFADYRYAHDYDFVLRTLVRFQPDAVAYCDQKLLLYRLHGSNTVKENFISLQKETLAVLRSHLPALMRCEQDRCILESYLSYVDEMLSQEHNLLETFLRTRSWRITKPLRAILDRCQRLRV